MSFFLSMVVVPIVLVGNKKDLENDVNFPHDKTNIQRIKMKDCHAVAQKIGAFAYLECSAKLNDGVKEVFDMAFRAIFPIKEKKVTKKKDIDSMVMLCKYTDQLEHIFLLGHGTLSIYITSGSQISMICLASL